MEEVGGCRDVGDLDIVLGAELEETFQAGRGVLGTLAFVAVRQEEHEAAGAVPLRFAGGEKLIDDNLGAVGEIPELSFPDAEHIGVIKRVAVVETEHGGFGEQRVVNAETGLLGIEVLEGRVGGVCLHVVEHSVAVAEGAAFAVLAAEPDGFVFEHEGAKGEGLTEAPVDRAAVVVRGDAGVEEAFDFGIGLEAGREGGETADDTVDQLGGDAGGDFFEMEVGLEDGGGAGEFFGLGSGGAFGGFCGLGCFGFFEILFEGGAVFGFDCLGLGVGDRALGDEFAGQDGGDLRVGGDFPVEERLREGGLVGLVVAVLAIAIHVDHDVAGPLGAEGEGELRDHTDGLGVVTVDVKNRGLDHLRDVGAVARGAGVAGLGGEADLVIDDKVEGAAGLVAGELGELECLGDDALTGERRVTVDEEREDAIAVFHGAADALAGAGFALDDGIDDFEVGRVGGEADLDRFAGGGVEDGLVAEMVFYITVARDGFGQVVFGKLFEEDVEIFPHDARQDIETTAVGHAHDDFFDADVRAVFDDGVDGGHHGFSALEGEAFLADVFGVEEAFEELGLVDAAENADFFGLRKIG